MAKYLSNRQRNLKVGISSYTESNTVLEVTGKVGIGTTNANSRLDVRGTISIGRTDSVGINSIRSVTDINSWEYGGVFKATGTEDGTPQDIFFKDDGTKMYILGDSGNEVNEYSLSTAWDVSTAGFTTVFSTSLQETNPTGLYFKPDGTRMYICGGVGVSPTGDYARSYTLSTPWDISTASYDSILFNVGTQDITPQGIYLKDDDGTKMYIVGFTGDAVYEYSLGTAWNVSTATFTTSLLVGATNTQNLPLTLTAPVGIDFNASGTKMYIIDQTRDVVSRFDLSTPWDISTAIFFDNVYIGFQELNPTGVYYQEDQSKAYIVGTTNDTVYQFNTDVPSLELASSGISTRSSIILNNEARLNNRLYVTGDTHISSNTNVKGSLTVDGSTTIVSNLTVSGGTITAGNVAATLLGNTSTNIVMAGSQTTGTLQIGAAAQTGTMTVGLSTASQTTNIQAGANASGTQKTINLGTGGASGSRTLITVGSATAGAISTVTIPSPTNLLIGTATTTGTASQPLQVTGGAYVSGDVGIGTTNPTTNLDINGGLRVRGALYDTDNQPGTSGQILVSTGSGIDWVNSASASAISGITIREEGTIVGTADSVSSINFVGPNVTATASGAAATITIADYVSSSGVATYATSSGISTNLKGGLVGNIPYQSAADTTTFLSNGTSGFILQSNGVGNAPSWVAAAPASAINGITIREEGSVAGTANSVSSINFVGPNVTATASGSISTVTIADYVSNSGVSTSVSGGIASVTSLSVSGISTISVNSSTDALRITQTGAGNALVVEDSANPDATPFVVRGDGNTGIGTTNPVAPLHLQNNAPLIRFTETDGATNNRNWNVGVNEQEFYWQALNDAGSGGGNLFKMTRSAEQIQTFEGRNAGNTWFITNNNTQRVGIGTSIASAVLDVRGNPWFSPNTTGVKATALRLGRFVDGVNAAFDILTDDNTGDDIEIQSNRYTGKIRFSRSSPSGIQTTFILDSNYQTGTSISIADTTGTSTKIKLDESGNTFFNNSGAVLVGTISSTGTASQPLQVTGGAYVSGNLGVGRTNPSSKLEVLGTIQTYSTDQTSVGSFAISNAGLLDITAYRSTGGVLRFVTADSSGLNIERGRVDSSGNFIIGATSSTGTASQPLQVTGGAYVSGNTGIGTTNPTSKLSVVGDGNFTGVVTATTFIGALTGTATTASSVTVNSVGLGTHTYGDYVKDITGTTNQITVTSGTGEGSSPTLSIPNQFTAPQDVTVTRDLQVNRNLNVNGNITIGGTSATLFTTEFKVYDPDIVLGFRTDGSGNDVSNDNTANHGGIAIASTEGTPLISLYDVGVGETNPATYKKFMWFKSGTFSGLGTDAWISNYAIGIGSTQVPNGVRLAAGGVQFTENDLSAVRNINASGIITSTGLTVNGNVSINNGTGNVLNLNNGTITQVHNIEIADPGTNEGIQWLNGNGWRIYEAPDTLTNAGGNLQFNLGSGRLFTMRTDGSLSVPGIVTATGLQITSGITTLGITTFTGTVSFGTSAYFGDNDVAYFGDSNDLEIYHNGSNSIIKDAGTGILVIGGSSAVQITNANLNEFAARFLTDGAVELYYDNTKEFETTGYGATVFGVLQSQGLNVSGVSTFQSNVFLGDNDSLYFGNSNDLQIIHDGSNSWITDTGTGYLGLVSNGTGVMLQKQGGEFLGKFLTDGAVELYYDNTKEFETTGAGVTVFGTTETQQLVVSGVSTFQGNVFLGDNDSLYFGDSNDLRIYHNGSDSAIDDQGTGNLQLITNGSAIRFFKSGGETLANFNTDGAVELYYDNSKKFETTGVGVTVFGILQSQGLNVSGVSTLGITSTTNLTTQTLNISGIATINQLDVNQLSPDGVDYGTNTYVPVANGSGGWSWQTVSSAGAGNLNGIDIRDEGNIVGTAGSTTSIDFRGNNITATGTAGGSISTVRVSDTPTFNTLNVSGVTTVGFITATNIWNAGITTSSRITLNGANDGATGGGQIYLNGATGNRIDFNTNGIGAPAFATRSAGTKIVLYPDITASRVDHALGIESNTLWYSIPEAVSARQHRWYAGTTQLADLKGSGELVIGSSTLTGTASQRLQVTGGAYVSGSVGIGTTNPQRKLHLRAQGADGIFLDNTDQTGSSGGPLLRVRGQRVDSNTSQSFSGQLVLEKWRMDGSINSGQNLGAIIFGGNFDTLPGITTGITYGASIGAIAEGAFSNINTAPTAIVFNTGTVGLGTLTLPNLTYGTEAARITSNRNLLIGATTETGTASQRLQVTGGAYVSGNLGVGNTNPGAKLDVTGDIRLSASDPEIEFNTGGPRLKVPAANTLTIHTGGGLNTTSNEVIRINNTGVGIGTNNPTVALQLSPTASISNVGSGITLAGTVGSALTVAQFYYANTNATYLRIKATRNTAGADWTTASTKLLTVTDVTEQGYIEYNPNGANYGMAFGSGATEWARFLSSGNLGIGRTNPSSKLEVLGTIQTYSADQTSVGSFAISNAGLLDITSFKSTGGTLRFVTANTSGTNLDRGRVDASGNFIIGSTSATGTASQPLQVTGGAYVSGNVGIGTTNPQYKLHVVGSFGATTKSFIIDHPTKEGKKLQYGSLEGPELGVYVRGRTQSSIIELPDYWTGLVDEETITVNLTPIGESATPRVNRVINNTVEIFSKEEGELDYYYTVFAERKDVAKLEVEF